MSTNTEITSTKATILFDGVCNLCNGSVNFIIDRDPEARFQFVSLQSSLAKELLLKFDYDNKEFESILLIKKGRLYEKSDAVIEIAKDLHGFWSIMTVFKSIPRSIRNGMYDLIAKHRYKWFGRTDTCRVPTEDLQYRFLDS